MTTPIDLARLSDAELVAKIEAAWQAYADSEARKTSAWDYSEVFGGCRSERLRRSRSSHS
jgi:hypothetical protein